MKKRKLPSYGKIRVLIALILTMFLASIFFGMALELNDGWYYSDSPLHIEMGKKLEGYSIEDLIVFLFNRFLGYPTLQLLFAIWETLAVILTWFICQKFIDKFFNVNRWTNLLISTGLQFLTSIYIPRYYPFFYKYSLGTQPWHNSTYFGMRFGAILFLYFFLESYPEYLNGITLRRWMRMATVLIVTTMYKPNFFITFCGALGIALIIDLLKYRTRDSWKKALVQGSIIVPSGIVLGVQFFLLYGRQSDPVSGIKLVGLSPLLWEGGFRHMLLKIARDLVFPGVVWLVTVLPGQKKRKMIGKINPNSQKQFHFMILMYFTAVLVFSLFSETGPRANHGNFSWGVYLAYFTMYLYLVPFFCQSVGAYRKNCLTAKTHINVLDFCFTAGSVLLLCHLVSGLCYITIVASGRLYLR